MAPLIVRHHVVCKALHVQFHKTKTERHQNSLATPLLQRYSYIAIKINTSHEKNFLLRSYIYYLFHTDCHTRHHTASFIEQFYNAASYGGIV